MRVLCLPFARPLRDLCVPFACSLRLLCDSVATPSRLLCVSLWILIVLEEFGRQLHMRFSSASPCLQKSIWSSYSLSKLNFLHARDPTATFRWHFGGHPESRDPIVDRINVKEVARVADCIRVQRFRPILKPACESVAEYFSWKSFARVADCIRVQRFRPILNPAAGTFSNKT